MFVWPAQITLLKGRKGTHSLAVLYGAEVPLMLLVLSVCLLAPGRRFAMINRSLFIANIANY